MQRSIEIAIHGQIRGSLTVSVAPTLKSFQYVSPPSVSQQQDRSICCDLIVALVHTNAPSSSSWWWYARNQSLLADDSLKCVSRDANPRKSRLLIARVIGFRDVLLSFFFRLSFFRIQGFSSTVLTSLPMDSQIVDDLIRTGSYRSCSVVIVFVRINIDRVKRSNCAVSLDRRR